MSTSQNPSTAGKAADPREALSESERRASTEQPESFKEAETDEKIVEILPIDREGDAIKGIDPKK